MTSEVVSFSLKKNDLSKVDRKPVEFGSHSSRSDRLVSASKSNKAFQESLRKNDSITGKPEDFNSPLKQKLLFGKSEHEKSKESKNLYIVDLSKKIKKVDSPFFQSQETFENQEKHQCSETNMLVSSFDSISQKIEDQVESSNSIVKMSPQNEEVEFKNLALEIKQVIDNFDLEDSRLNMNQQSMVQEKFEDSQQKSSSINSLKSKSSENIRLRKKEKKIKKKKEKEMIAKKMKQKLSNITNFVDELHKKESHTNRKELIEELSNHLCEGRFMRLRNELKKLI